MEVLLNVLAGVALLIWGTHLVRTGILRIYGGKLRQHLSRSVANRFKAFVAGIGVTGLLQSSTATALITTSFVGDGLIATAPALAIMLGADVGTALVVKLLSLNLSWLWPLLVVVGVALLLGREGMPGGRFGRVLIGFGLILLALQLIVAATKPLTQAAGVKVIFQSLTGDVMLDILIAAGLTLLCYSSLAVVLLTATLAAATMISAQVSLGLVLGANLGGSLLAVLATVKMSPDARRVTLGNMLFKVIGCIAVVPFLPMIGRWFASMDSTPAHEIINFHLAFNVAVAIVFIGLTSRVARLTQWLLPSQPMKDTPSAPRYLDPVALETPTLAISCASRETLRLGDMIETMLRGVLDVLKNDDSRRLAEIRRMDDDVDDLYTSIKLYLTQVSRDALDERESRRWADIISFTINLEHIGDIIDKNLSEIAEKKIRKHYQFSAAGMEEISTLHARVLANLQLALNIFVNGDLKSAQRLLAEKEQMRELERTYADSHLQRLAENAPQSIETSSLHLDIIRDLKRINSHLCAVAYPIIEEAGLLAPSRLRETRKRARAAASAVKPATADQSPDAGKI